MQKAKTMSLALCLTILGTLMLSGCGSMASTSQPGANTPVSVDVTKAAKGWLNQGSLYIGSVQPEQEVDVVPKMAGKVSEVEVSVGSHVKKGDVLYKMDDKDLSNAVAQAQASVASAQAGVQTTTTQQQSGVNQASSGAISAKSGVIQAQNAVTQAQNTLVQAQNTELTTKKALDDATTNKTRYEQLYAASAASKAELDQYETAYVKAQSDYSNAQKGVETAQAALAAAQQAVTNAQSGYETAQQQISVAQSKAAIAASQKSVESAQAALKTVQDQLADTIVTSPIDGVVGIKNVEVGNFINPDFPSSEPTLVVANLNPAKVIVYIPASDINRVKVDAPAMIRAVSINTYLQGKVKSISPLDKGGKGYPVEISIPNPDLVLKKGMVTEVSLVSSSAKEGIIIPTSAVIHENDKAYVYVPQKDSAKRVEITIGQQEGSQTLVTKGLNEGDTIISTDVELLHDQEKIAVKASDQ